MPCLKDLEKEIEKHCSKHFCGIVSFEPWVHPRNAVANCIAFSLDGSIQYKFSWTYDYKLLVAEVRCTHWVDFKIHAGDVFTLTQFLKIVKNAKYYDVFGRRK